MEIREIISKEESSRVFPLIADIRNHLTLASYLEVLKAAREEGYKLLGLYEGEDCLGLMGYRILSDFVHGRHLYIDDLVIAPKERSKGLGPVLLERAHEIGASTGCSQIRLCTGVDNTRGKSFYEKNDWSLRAVVYKKKL